MAKVKEKDRGATEYANYLLVKWFWEEKLSKSRTADAYRDVLQKLRDRVDHYNCKVIPALSDCLAVREQEIAAAKACCDKHKNDDDIIKMIVDGIDMPDCPPAPEPQPDPDPCDDEDEDDGHDHGGDDHDSGPEAEGY
jgi:hypothetical protein